MASSFYCMADCKHWYFRLRVPPRSPWIQNPLLLSFHSLLLEGTHVFALNIDMDVFRCAVYPSTGLKNTKTGDQFLLPWTVITGDENTSAVLRSYNLCVSHASEGTYGWRALSCPCWGSTLSLRGRRSQGTCRRCGPSEDMRCLRTGNTFPLEKNMARCEEWAQHVMPRVNEHCE